MHAVDGGVALGVGGVACAAHHTVDILLENAIQHLVRDAVQTAIERAGVGVRAITAAVPVVIPMDAIHLHRGDQLAVAAEINHRLAGFVVFADVADRDRYRLRRRGVDPIVGRDRDVVDVVRSGVGRRFKVRRNLERHRTGAGVDVEQRAAWKPDRADNAAGIRDVPRDRNRQVAKGIQEITASGGVVLASRDIAQRPGIILWDDPS